MLGNILLETNDKKPQKSSLTELQIKGKQTHFLSSFTVEMTFQHH
jgi:hypothetical protein